MKIRQGFVSNSSSSSFIIFLDKEPQDPDELQDMLFDEDMEEVEIYNMSLTTKEISGIVFYRLGRDYENWEQLKEDEKNDVYGTLYDEELDKKHDKLNKEYFAGCEKIKEEFEKANPGENIFKDKLWGDKYWKYSREKADEIDEEYIKDLKELYNSLKGNKKCYMVEFYDDGDDGNVLEHGDIFRNIPHIRISHH